MSSGRRWDGRFVRFANTQESNTELCVARYTGEKGAARWVSETGEGPPWPSTTHFWICKYLGQSGMLVLSQCKPRSMYGCPKKPKPMPAPRPCGPNQHLSRRWKATAAHLCDEMSRRQSGGEDEGQKDGGESILWPVRERRSRRECAAHMRKPQTRDGGSARTSPNVLASR